MWAIQQGGFDAVIAPSFSDIFRNNCTKNGLVPVVLPEDVGRPHCGTSIEADPTTEIIVDMERLQVEVPSAGLSAPFPMDAATQHRFLNGLDDVGITLTHADEIDAFETAPPRLVALTRLETAPRSGVGVRTRQVAQLRVVGEHLDRRRDVEPQRALQDAHLRVLVVLGQRDRPAVAAGAGGATAAVQVVLAVAGAARSG